MEAKFPYRILQCEDETGKTVGHETIWTCGKDEEFYTVSVTADHPGAHANTLGRVIRRQIFPPIPEPDRCP